MLEISSSTHPDLLLDSSVVPIKPREQGFISAPDGTSLYYEVHGEGKPLLFCYGLTCRREHWHHQLSHYAQTHQVILFDYRGHHASGIPKNDQNLTLEWCARDVGAVVKHLGLKEVVLFGHSMGVPIVAETMHLIPKQVKAAVFICGAVTNPFKHMFSSSRMEFVYQLYSRLHFVAPDTVSLLWRRMTSRSWFSHFLTSRLGFNPTHSNASDVHSYLDGVHDTPWQVFFSLISDYTRYDGRRLLKEINCPVLVIAGRREIGRAHV